MRKKKNSKLRSALAIFLAGAMVLGMIPGGMGQVYASDSTPTPAVAFDETSVSDPSTVDTWNQVVKDSTENIGRIWTDKTVLTEDIQLEGGSRPSVKKGDSDFLVGLFSSKSDVDIIYMGKIALLLSAPSHLFKWFTMTVGSFLTGLEKATESIVVMLVESVILPLILIVVLTKAIGVYGIFIAPSIGGIISVAIAFILWRKCVKEEFENN